MIEKKDWSEIVEVEVGEERCWVTADSQAHYDLKSAEARRDQLVLNSQTEGAVNGF